MCPGGAAPSTRVVGGPGRVGARPRVGRAPAGCGGQRTAEGAPAWGLRVCLEESPSSMPPRCPLAVHPPRGPAGQSDPCSGSFSQVPKGVCVLEHAEYQVSPAGRGEWCGGEEGLWGQGPGQARLVGAPLPVTGGRPGGGEAPRGPTSPALPVPKARLSSLFIQVPELRLHRPQGQRHAAQRHHLHPRALQHHLQPGEQPRPGALGPPTSCRNQGKANI